MQPDAPTAEAKSHPTTMEDRRTKQLQNSSNMSLQWLKFWIGPAIDAITLNKAM